MKRLRIFHSTDYSYHQPVKFGPHRALMRPREGHDLHIARARVSISPRATLRWLRDAYDNSIAIATFDEPSDRLSISSEVDVELHYEDPVEWAIAPYAQSFPFQYPPEEHIDLMAYRLPSYPYDGPMLMDWLRDPYQPGQVVGTFDLLGKLNTHIFQSFKYAHREEPGVQLPNETLQRGSGSCRDFAVLMMEAARSGDWERGSSPVITNLLKASTATQPTPGQRSTSPVPDGAASIRQITSLSAANIIRLPSRANRRRLLHFPVPGKALWMLSTSSRFRCRWGRHCHDDASGVGVRIEFSAVSRRIAGAQITIARTRAMQMIR
jgi:hypothetical protein